MTQFSTWLTAELETRGWSRADFATRAGIRAATLDALLDAGKTPAPDLCATIARALELQAEDVFRYAGLIPANYAAVPASTTPKLETLARLLISLIAGALTVVWTSALVWGAFATAVAFLILSFIREPRKR